MMFESGIQCITGLVITSVVLFYLVRRLSVKPPEENRKESSNWAKLTDSKAGIVAQVLLYLMLVVSVGGVVGVITWRAIEGIAGIITASPKIFSAAIVGAVISTIGFGLFGMVLSLLGPILFVAYEDWTMYIAPIIGGTVGAAISGGLGVSVIYMVSVSALTGGISSVLYGMITTKARISFKNLSEHVIAGIGIGTVNGVIVAAVFKALELTVGISWLLAAQPVLQLTGLNTRL